MERQRECPYFVRTGNGPRCAFLSPEDWRLRQHALKEHCFRSGSGCPLRARVLSRMSNDCFLWHIRRSEEGEGGNL